MMTRTCSGTIRTIGSEPHHVYRDFKGTLVETQEFSFIQTQGEGVLSVNKDRERNDCAVPKMAI